MANQTQLTFHLQKYVEKMKDVDFFSYNYHSKLEGEKSFIV